MSGGQPGGSLHGRGRRWGVSRRADCCLGGAGRLHLRGRLGLDASEQRAAAIGQAEARRQVYHKADGHVALEDTAERQDDFGMEMLLQTIFGVGVAHADGELAIVVGGKLGAFQPGVECGAVELDLKLAECCLPGIFRGQHRNSPQSSWYRRVIFRDNSLLARGSIHGSRWPASQSIVRLLKPVE